MNLLYDHQIFSTQTYGGISRYFYELINNFINNDKDIDLNLSLKYSNNHYIKNITDFSYKGFFPNQPFRGKERLILDLNKSVTINALKKKNYDIFHPTYYDSYFLRYIDQKPYVVTVYDMIHELFRERFINFDVSTIKRKKEIIEKASFIIAISKNTKKDIIDVYGIDEKKIKVVYLGNSMNNTHNIENINVPQRYILYIGDRHVYKNFKFFIKSITPLLKYDNELYLVCGGSYPFKKDEIKLLKDSNIENKILHIKIKNDETLKSLYSNALAFIFPTLYEGFGIPVLEAMSCGCPVILSNTSSLPEVGGDAAVYFDPENSETILESVKRVINNNSLAEKMRIKGFEQIKYFSWDKCANETKKVYESLL